MIVDTFSVRERDLKYITMCNETSPDALRRLA
jgi:hypothetical protein